MQNVTHVKGSDPREKEKEKEKERERERERDRERAVAAAAKLQLQQAGIKYAPPPAAMLLSSSISAVQFCFCWNSLHTAACRGPTWQLGGHASPTPDSDSTRP